ncbi:class F sortase, partial [Streptomyces sp. NPDC001941]|uniref:class F sortase n=1 Tax=Streptomyces sp. NPDC001941 TaxID=3154659 RepID=UPI00332B5814
HGGVAVDLVGREALLGDDLDGVQREDGAAYLTGTPPDPLDGSAPDRVRIPAIGVDAPVTQVGRDGDGWIDAPPPTDDNLAGWYTGAVTPGERGTAVLVGHVDTRSGPAVFYGLGALQPGSRIEVRRADGRTAVFALYAIEVVPKEGFPADKVYRDATVPELRVITCGGGFTKKKGYDGNVVGYARLVDVQAN